MKNFLLIIFVYTCSLTAAFANGDTTALNIMKEFNIPGLSYAVVKNGKVVQKGHFGKANVELNVPLREQNIFPIFSTTKAFTGIATMKLVEEGRINPQDRISQYLEGLPAHWQNITVYQLLTLTSGLPDVVTEQKPGYPMGWVTEDEEELVLSLAGLPVQFAPGDSWSYNQTNLSLLGLIIKKVTGIEYIEYMEKVIFDPLNMENTRFGDVWQVVDNRVSNYGIKKDNTLMTWNTYHYPKFALPNAGLNLSLDDMIKFCNGITNNEILNEEYQQQVYTVAKLNNNKDNFLEEGIGFGMGWMVLNINGLRAFGMSGGAAAGFLIFPDHDLSVVLLTNASGLDVEGLILRIAAPHLP